MHNPVDIHGGYTGTSCGLPTSLSTRLLTTRFVVGINQVFVLKIREVFRSFSETVLRSFISVTQNFPTLSTVPMSITTNK